MSNKKQEFNMKHLKEISLKEKLFFAFALSIFFGYIFGLFLVIMNS
jgi:hypothetical protein